jgi:hypothetical protein
MNPLSPPIASDHILTSSTDSELKTLHQKGSPPTKAGSTIIDKKSGSRLLAGLQPVEEPPFNQSEQLTLNPRLVVIRGERLSVSYALLEGKNYIGRTSDQPVDIDLEGQEPVERIWTSRKHALISVEAKSFILEDLNSLNGTFVNRNRLLPGQKHQLQPGDVIQVGTVQLRFQI